MGLPKEELEALLENAAAADVIDYGDADICINYGSEKFFHKLDKLVSTALAGAEVDPDAEENNEEVAINAADSELESSWMHLIDAEHPVLEKVSDLVYAEATRCYARVG